MPSLTISPIVKTTVSVDAGSVAANQSLDVTATVKGLRKGYPVILWAESLTAGFGFSNVHCSAKDTLKFRLENHTASAIDPAAVVYNVIQF